MSDDDEVRTVHTIVPAAPGWYVAKFYGSDEDCDAFFDHHPIIAWDVERGDVMVMEPNGPWPVPTPAPEQRWRREWRPHRYAMPITPCDLVGQHYGFETTGFGTDWALKSPDGKYRLDGEVFDTDADALARLDRLAALRKAAERAAAKPVGAAAPSTTPPTA